MLLTRKTAGFLVLHLQNDTASELHPGSSVGIVTGKGSDLLILEFPSGEDGERAVISLDKKLGRLPKTCKVTGNGKRQLYFLYPRGFEIKHTLTHAQTETALAELRVYGQADLFTLPESLHPSHYMNEGARDWFWEADLESLLADWVLFLVCVTDMHDSPIGRWRYIEELAK